MKKLITIIPLLLTPMIGGCSSSNKVSLSTWSYKKEAGVEITSAADFMAKLGRENFLVALYYEHISCSCWRNFTYVIKEAVSKNNLQIYQAGTEMLSKSDYGGTIAQLGFDLITTNAPSFYIVSDGKIAYSYSYVDNYPLFSDYSKFISEINNKCFNPGLTYVTADEMDEIIMGEKATTLVMRNGCSDCTYAIPNVLYPYFKTHACNIYTLDIESYRPNKDDPQEEQERKAAEYQAIKDKYHLSEKYDSVYGYSTGVVPTFQVWSKGVVTDACVYLNDEVIEDGDNYVITNSYYTEERIKNLKYLNNVENKVLAGKTIAKTQYSSEIKALHLPILTAFLDTYTK